MSTAMSSKTGIYASEFQAEEGDAGKDRDRLLAALKGLVAEVPIWKLNVRKDFSLLNAHAYACKVIRQAEEVTS